MGRGAGQVGDQCMSPALTGVTGALTWVLQVPSHGCYRCLSGDGDYTFGE